MQTQVDSRGFSAVDPVFGWRMTNHSLRLSSKVQKVPKFDAITDIVHVEDHVRMQAENVLTRAESHFCQTREACPFQIKFDKAARC